MSWPDCCVSAEICSATFSLMIVELFHAALSMVADTRFFDRLFIRSALSLDIGQLFADEAVLHLEYIHSTHMSLFSGLIYPLVSPAHKTEAGQTKKKNHFFIFFCCLIVELF